MTFVYQIWFAGSSQPMSFECDGDELLGLFKRWVESDETRTARGWVHKKGGGETTVINFANVARLTARPQEEPLDGGISSGGESLVGGAPES